jgi:ribose-phosphate pyrophosphokinase
MDMGAASVRACATHGILSGPAFDNINTSKLAEVFITDTIPLPEGKDTHKIKVMSMTGTFASIIRKVYNYEPISPEFIF